MFFYFSLLILKKQTTRHHISIPNTFRAKLSMEKKNEERKKAINVAERRKAARRRLWRISLEKGLKCVNGSPSRKDKYKYWPTKWTCHDINWPDLNCTNSGEGNKISYCRAFIYILWGHGGMLSWNSEAQKSKNKDNESGKKV